MRESLIRNRAASRIAAGVLLSLLLGAVAAGQTTTSTLVGTATTGGAPLPGVTVTIASPRLQGVRTAVTTENGAYQFFALPPGAYTVTFELEGLQTITRHAELQLQETTRVDAELSVSTVSEAITVTAAAPSVLETSQVTSNFSAEQINELPVRRTINERLRLAPGVSSGGPNGQLIVSGAPSSQNLFIVNGVVVNENLRGQPHNLFIEDAIEETSILQGGASAEYGRFTGGVVSTITKSGGNDFSGSLRENFTNDNWTTKSDYQNAISGAAEPARVDKLNQIFEGTLGGRVIRDRLWFFAAGRYSEVAASAVTTATDLPFTQNTENTRVEGKLTAQITPRHSLVGSYLDLENIEGNNYFTTAPIIDLRSVSDRETPNSLLAVNYNGIFGANLLVSAQYSEKKFAFVGGGATGSDPIQDTLVIDITDGWRGWSPTFGAADAKRRDNDDLLLKTTYFLSTRRLGNHSLVAGYDEFHDLRRENNYQSGSNYRVFAEMIVNGSNWFMSLDPEAGHVIRYTPIRNLSAGADFETTSIYLNDRWEISDRWTVSAGARYDQNYGLDEQHNVTTDDSRISPRLGVVHDLFGDGRISLTASYGRFVATVDSGIGNSISAAGANDTYDFNYLGPAINPEGTPASQLLPTDEVLRRMFAWFQSVGGLKAERPVFEQALIRGQTNGIDGTLRSPYMDELSIGAGLRLGTNGFARVDVMHREWGDFFTIYQNLGTQRIVNGSKIDFGLYGNDDSGDLERRYNGVQLQASYRFFNRLDLAGNYTWSTLRGNVEGENAASGTIASAVHSRPEYRAFAQHNPVGYLNGDVRHRANVWAIYAVPTPVGRLSVSLLERFESGMPYSAVGSIDVRRGTATGPADGIVNPGYVGEPASVLYYFSDRGEFRTDNLTATDVGLNFSVPLFGVSLFFEGDVFNVFNQQSLHYPVEMNTTVYTRANGRTFPAGRRFGQSNTPGGTAVSFNPATTTPVEYVYGASDPTGSYHFARDINFGKANTRDAYQEPRTYRFALGLRF